MWVYVTNILSAGGECFYKVCTKLTTCVALYVILSSYIKRQTFLPYDPAVPFLGVFQENENMCLTQTC